MGRRKKRNSIIFYGERGSGSDKIIESINNNSSITEKYSIQTCNEISPEIINIYKSDSLVIYIHAPAFKRTEALRNDGLSSTEILKIVNQDTELFKSIEHVVDFVARNITLSSVIESIEDFIKGR